MSRSVATIRCPICEKQFDPAESRAMPFCSERCRQIDLGRWLREAYSVPVERNPDEEDESQSPNLRNPDHRPG
jgi:endogenous inhibitor of DNA gyrase (YacG/DUF329 family)